MSAANDNHPVEEVRMKTKDLMLISVDDHVCEPADMFEAHVPQKYRQYAPRVETDPSGGQQVWYGEVMGRNLGLAASAGKPHELCHINPCRYEEMRPGCYQVSERVRDMDTGRQLAGLNFPNCVELIDKVNVSNAMWEGDFPHADTSWPYGPETAMKNLGSLSDELIQMITHENAIWHFQFDPFRGRPRSECSERFRETAKSAAFLTANDPADGGTE
jgi:hypothetical protein